jgi:diguanylate cyclase (GGDEF)-like protein
MRLRRSFLLLYLLPVVAPVVFALGLNYWSMNSVRALYEQSDQLARKNIELQTETVNLSYEMSAVQNLVNSVLAGASGGDRNAGRLYQIHARIVDRIAAIKQRVRHIATTPQAMELSPKDVLDLSEHADQYANLVIMATDTAIDAATAEDYVSKAQVSYYAFAEHAHRLTALLAERAERHNTAAATAFNEYFNRVLQAGLATMLGVLLLAVLTAKIINRRLLHVVDSLRSLQQGVKAAEALPKIEAMSTDDHSGFGEIAKAVLKFRDELVVREQTEAQIRDIAFYDALTHLPNRRLLLDRIQQAMIAGTRSGQSGALMFIDMDNFKKINDSRGHEAGDQLLVDVGTRLLSCVREGDTVARLGGDEFVVLVNGLSQETSEASAQAVNIAEKIRFALNQPYLFHDQANYSSPSLGIALFHGNTTPGDQLLGQADAAMYQAKSAGRNAIRLYGGAAREQSERLAPSPAGEGL